tara:strand:+ start:170 stop:547 length:378 start_codon:yes stop_codon:yes gene_type:complete
MKQLQNKRFYFYLASSISWFFLIVYLLIFYKSVDVDVKYPTIYFDKIIHFLLFFVQSFLITKTYFSVKFSFNFFKMILILLLIFCFLIEIIQIIVPYRTFEYSDLLSNILGSVLGSVFGYFLVSK